MNNDIILEICIAGLNCRAGYATGHDPNIETVSNQKSLKLIACFTT